MATETWAVAMVRDEADIIEQTITRMLGQVDRVLVADNGSVDGTREILEALDVELVDDPEPGYYQSRKMSTLAAHAADAGADWVIPMDADEAWYSPFGRIADVLADLPPHIAVAPAEVYDHVPTGEDPAGPPLQAIGWRRRDPGALPKTAARARVDVVIEQGNHGAHYPAAAEPGLLVVRHFPYRSAEQFVRKARNGAAAYAATDLPDHQGAHWRQYGALLDANGPEALEDVFRTWFWSPAPATDTGLILDPCPA